MRQQPPHRAMDQRVVAEQTVLKGRDADHGEARHVTREAFYVDLYRLDVIGASSAAVLLGMSHTAFMDLVTALGLLRQDEAADVTRAPHECIA